MAVDARANLSYSNYHRVPGLVLGFHGCDSSVGELVLSGKQKHLKASTNLHDWLGSGIYFWENDPMRALEWAREAQAKPALSSGKITEPFVIGAVIELGLSLNLMARECLEEMKVAHEVLTTFFKTAKKPLPVNKGGDGAPLRFLDRAVIEMLHRTRQETGISAYSTVRASFKEGESVYPGADFQLKSHIQIAVRSQSNIRAYFRPFVD